MFLEKILVLFITEHYNLLVTMKKITLIILGIIVCIIILIYIIGLFLPKQRVYTKESVFNTSTQKLFDIVCNNQQWQWRSDLMNLNIISTDNKGLQVWDEIDKQSNIIHFKAIEKIPYSYYHFTMENSIMIGYWIGEFIELEGSKTKFIATEYIEMKNPITKVLSYLFFDIAKYMDTYQKDLGKRVESIEQSD